VFLPQDICAFFIYTITRVKKDFLSSLKEVRGTMKNRVILSACAGAAFLFVVLMAGMAEVL
jgi:hypothetical protein